MPAMPIMYQGEDVVIKFIILFWCFFNFMNLETWKRLPAIHGLNGTISLSSFFDPTGTLTHSFNFLSSSPRRLFFLQESVILFCLIQFTDKRSSIVSCQTTFWRCDRCDTPGKYTRSPSDQRFGCDLCDFDLCRTCHFLRGEVKMTIRRWHPQNMSANQRAKGISNSYIHHTLMSLPWWYMMENTISRFSVSRRLAGVCSRIYSNNRRITRSRVLLLFLLRLVVPVSLMWLFLVQITSIRNLVGNGWWFCTSANRSVRVVTLLSIFQRIISWSDIITNLCFDSCHRPVRIALPSFLHFVLYSVSVRPQQIMHAIVAINQSDLFDVWISTYMWATMRG